MKTMCDGFISQLLYAWGKVRSMREYTYIIARRLIHLTDWFRGNKLSLNVTKTNYMLFSNATKCLPEFQLHINDQLIEKTECTTFLGIHIDDKLKWDVHINKIKSRLSSSLYAINKIKHFAPIKILTTLYYSMVYPYLIYGITQWGSTFKTHINKLNIMQKKDYEGNCWGKI